CLTVQREVLGDLAESQKHARLITQGRDGGLCPEQRAVLPHAPPFFLVSPVASGSLELEFGVAPRAILRRVEEREVPADSFIPAISLYLLGAAIPAEDVPVCVEREDRAVP